MKSILYLFFLASIAFSQDILSDPNLAFGEWRLALINGGYLGIYYVPDTNHYLINVSRDTAESTAVLVAKRNDTIVNVIYSNYDSLIYNLGIISQFGAMQSFDGAHFLLWDLFMDGYWYTFAKISTLAQRTSLPSQNIRTFYHSGTIAIDLLGRISRASYINYKKYLPTIFKNRLIYYYK